MNQSKIIFIIILSVVFGMPIKTTYANIKSISYYSGNAMGGWYQDIVITPNAINKITHKGNARSGGISTKFKEMSISYDKWQSIINKIDINKFHSLPKNINCEYMPVYCIRSDGPIIADGDGISITIDDGIKIKRVGFAKFNVRIPDFDPFLKQMNEINLEMESVKFTDIK
jgi:hypothetical protein